METTRIDKWLWAARFFKTRSLASDEISHGRVQINQGNVKPAREVRIGDVITIVQARVARTVAMMPPPAAWISR